MLLPHPIFRLPKAVPPVRYPPPACPSERPGGATGGATEKPSQVLGALNLRSDYAAHPLGALSWRFQAAMVRGHGILGDLGSHAVDLTSAVLGDLEALVAQTATFIRERPLPDEGEAAYGHGLGRSDAPSGLVENEDYLVALARTRRGALVTLECSRVATGEQNSYRVEVHASQGFVAWDYRTTGELWVSSGIEYVDQPVRRVLVGAEAGDYARFQPGSANAMSYDDTKVIELSGFVRSILSGVHEGAQLTDAVAAAEALDAMVRSAAGAGWVELGDTVTAPGPTGVIGIDGMGAPCGSPSSGPVAPRSGQVEPQVEPRRNRPRSWEP